ncbi:right-handed parallel beta-helix repeat-containing protein [Pelagibius sp. Alg239-R121]|uniref:right-handed parallel beta-helix repeat-containing protein n=1 Tax=Pelagibius sp. Alg239-R121 TaxID=2993448 RepID=UPI0024A66D12|nr:right-handed parallel beta-helix repeat-containing protein [Pelagibius sp. Alg239-R121]
MFSLIRLVPPIRSVRWTCLQLLVFLTIGAAVLWARNVQGQSESAGSGAVNSTPGEVLLEPSTFRSIAVRWPILGDANKNAQVTVRFRRADEKSWHEGYPLFRPLPERMSVDNRVSGGWLFAGSVVELKPGQDYVVELTLSDTDGVTTGEPSSTEVTKEITVATRPEPGEAKELRQLFVVPRNSEVNNAGDGSSDQPFNGLKAAENSAEPGDLFILRPGLYRVPGFKITRSGETERPIVYRGQEGAVLDGGGGEVLVNVNRTSHRWFEGLVFQNADRLLSADYARDLLVRRNRFNFSQYGVTSRWASYTESQNNAVLDNVFQGITKWPRSKGIEETYAVELTGSGHVIAHNLFRNVGDAVHNGERGRMSASDVYGNEIVTCTDDGIETDYSDTNVRVFRNRITNCYAGISGQPVHGGPVYVFRNVIYNTQYAPFKLHNDTSGLLLFHNTSVRAGIPLNIQPGRETVSNVVTRNNIFVGTRSPALRSTGHMIETDFDSDGFAWGIGAGDFAVWNNKRYRSLEDAKRSKRLYRKRGAVSLYSHRTFKDGFLPPKSFKSEYKASVNLPQLRPKSQAADRGEVLPNFNDGFAGKAPDLGCCEEGQSLPRYGPRPEN